MGAVEFDNSGHSVGEMRRLIAQAQASGETARANHLESELNWRMRRMAARAADAAAYAGGSYADEGEPHAADDAAADRGAGSVTPWPSPLAAARRAPARVWQLAAAALAGAAVASVAGWWITSAGLAPRPAPAPVAEAVRTAPSPPAAPVAAAPAESLAAASVIPAPVTATAAPKPSSPAARRPAACRAPASPGQQAVCASRTLLAQDQRMLRAYQRAVAAGASRPTLDRGQAQWREQRDRTSSPARLARLYRTRIATLNAAAHRTHAPAHATARHARHHKWWRW